MTALAMILSYVESLIPFYAGFPGIKLGLANLVIVLLLYTGTIGEALVVSCMRILLTGFLFGNLYSMLFSLSGGLISLLVMWLIRKIPGFGVMGVSIAGGVAHNMAQLAVAVLVVETYQLVVYFPVLLAAGTLTGAGIGILAAVLLERAKLLRRS
ncbi:MAG: Gx transporter family protein [Eubacteriales bacterium]|nr:Gx transporter family protein [Eubacteriales bacterium]